MIQKYLPRLHLAFERTSRTLMSALARGVARNNGFSIVESLSTTSLTMTEADGCMT
jgi:hypothetical protein